MALWRLNAGSAWRWVGLLLLLLLALQAGRSAIAAAWADRRPELVRFVWPSHPTALFSEALAGIGSAAAKGQAPGTDLLEQVERGSRKAPLAVEPLLVDAAARLAAGDRILSEKLLLAAVRRDARQPAARFLLADLYVRQGRVDDALTQIIALDRRLGGVSTSFAPALASFLEQPGSVSRVAPILRRNPALRDAVLAQVAENAAATGTILALAGPGDAPQPWFAAVFERLLRAGDIRTARDLSARAESESSGLALSPWKPGPPTGPLGWRFPATNGGAAEPVAGRSLRLVYYGRAETVLAEHLLLLEPGRYRLSQHLKGSVSPGMFEWRLACLNGSRAVSTIPIGVAGTGGGEFLVLRGCSAQRLQLAAQPGDFARTTSLELSGVTLARGGQAR